MKNFLFYLGHAMLVTGIVCFKIANVGPVSWIFLIVAVACYVAGILGSGNSLENFSFGEVINVKGMTKEEKAGVTGIIIWRNCYSDRVFHWDVDKKNFVSPLNPVYEKVSRHSHTLYDYEEAAKAASLIQQTGMLYFLCDTEMFPKDKSLCS